MIESEDKRKRLNDIVTRWCNHIHATPLLREGDISGLVQSIMCEFYHVVLSCGHMVKSIDDGFEYAADSDTYGIECADCHENRLNDIQRHSQPIFPLAIFFIMAATKPFRKKIH